MRKFKITGLSKLLGAVIVSCGTGASVQAVSDITMNYSSIVGTTIGFGGGTVTFQNDGSGNSFQITASTGILGDSVGYIGSITGGPLVIGPISGPPSFQQATLTGTETVTITGGGNTLTMTVDFKDITQVGAGGQLNVNAVANVMGLVEVPGLPSDLTQFAGVLFPETLQNMTMSWSFASPETLTDLASGSSASHTIGYSGQFSAQRNIDVPPNGTTPDTGTTAFLLSPVVIGLAALRRKLSR